MSESITAEIFAALDILVLERLDVGKFKISGNIPKWVRRFCRQIFKPGMEILIPEQEFPFLENFLIDAEEYWQRNDEKLLKSGIWTDLDISGTEFHFEASALVANHKKILLVERMSDAYTEKQSLIQQARENKLNYQHILKENQKKEVLIHCIIHDVAGQLSGINCCLALLELENLTEKGRERLEIGRKQTIKQEMLIREILNAFSQEIQSLESFTDDIETAPDVLVSVFDAIESFTPTFTLNQMRLQLSSDIDLTADWRIVGDKSRLDRILANLIENAFRHSPPNTTVTINLQQQEDYILVSVEDQGSGVPEEIADTLFQKFTQGKKKSGKSGLGLYFCKITVERWGGQIGFTPRENAGSRFWFTLLKAATSNGE
ncbi:MAG: sensor histidine kinase [Richelia sp. RM2_1_2]|nr:sensor histidine kinase [Richelia sp. SM1_7_0]NJN09072.1 sensor histidine kinase [Richelia sp. RM1_1_1]NJO26832.1 sensor histidine kinase [Richelia sp. SL_2_1]NJO58605.1 sensor histidine kinase [Richelia sp. RM2_1_2]